MAVAYVGRASWSDSVAQIVPGSVLVGVGTTLAYSTMPTLIMRAVPLTETASANGLDVLLRSVGTSTVSASAAAITAASVIIVAGDELPAGGALTSLLWLAAVASAATAIIGVPMQWTGEYAVETGSAGVERRVAEA